MILVIDDFSANVTFLREIIAFCSFFMYDCFGVGDFLCCRKKERGAIPIDDSPLCPEQDSNLHDRKTTRT